MKVLSGQWVILWKYFKMAKNVFPTTGLRYCKKTDNRFLHLWFWSRSLCVCTFVVIILNLLVFDVTSSVALVGCMEHDIYNDSMRAMWMWLKSFREDLLRIIMLLYFWCCIFCITIFDDFGTCDTIWFVPDTFLLTVLTFGFNF